MKTLIATLIAAAALVGTQASADYDKVYTLSQMVARSNIDVPPDEGALNVLVNVDDTRELRSISVPECAGLTLDFQGDYVLTCALYIDAPFEGITNITTSVPDVEALWKERFSVEGGGSNTLCTGMDVGGNHGPLQLFGAEAGSTVSLDGTEVVYKGAVDGLELLQQNEVGIVWGEKDIKLVGKIDAEPGPTPPVPEPTTGSLSLLALAGLCARRRRK